MADPLRRQVRSETRLRYGQSLSDLLGARHTAYHQYQNDVSTAEQSAHAVKQSAKQAIGQLRQIYDQADQTRKVAAEQIRQATNIAEAPHSALAQALSGESAIATQQMRGERQAAQGEAVSRGQDATAGLVYAKHNALSNYRDTRAGLMDQTRNVHSQMGDFAQSRLSDLQQQQAAAEAKATQDAQSQANSDRTYNLQVAKARGLDPVTGKPLPGKKSKLNAAGVKPLTIPDNNKVLDNIQSIVGMINGSPQFEDPPKDAPAGAKGPKLTPQRIRQHLLNGTNPLGKPIPEDLVKVAWSLSKYGGGKLGHSETRALLTRGVRIPKAWIPPKFTLPANWRPEVSVGPPRGYRGNPA